MKNCFDWKPGTETEKSGQRRGNSNLRSDG